MPTHKQDKRLRERHFGMTILFTLPFLICFALAWSRPLFLVGAIGYDVILRAGVVSQELRLRRYHCPDCGALLPYTPAASYARIDYFCSRCDVTLDSG